jgi:hypothetical protein
LFKKEKKYSSTYNRSVEIQKCVLKFQQLFGGDFLAFQLKGWEEVGMALSVSCPPSPHQRFLQLGGECLPYQPQKIY